MTIKLKDLEQKYTYFSDISDEKAPLKIVYWITKNIAKMDIAHKMYVRQRNQIWADCLYVNPDGTIATKQEDGSYKYNLKDGKQDEFISRINELENFDVEIDPYILDFDSLLNIETSWVIAPKYMNGLLEFLSFGN
jgi:hypothetical protein